MAVLRHYKHPDEIADIGALFALIDSVHAGPPYYYQSEHMLAKNWALDTLRVSSDVLIAYADDAPIGYCFAQPYASCTEFLNSPVDYGVSAETCRYLSELGVAQHARGLGLGKTLVGDFLDGMPPCFDSVLVRTPQAVYGSQDTNPAIRFYRQLGFEFVTCGGDMLVETSDSLNHRPRVFLRWQR